MGPSLHSQPSAGPSHALPTSPFVSVVVPMRNEERYIGEALDSLLAQDYPPESLEVIVADGCSTDRSAQIVRDYACRDSRIRVVANQRVVVSAGRNAGIRAARGDIIAIVDAHCYVGPGFLRHVARVFAETGADCLGRPIEQYLPQDGYTQRAIAVARASPLGGNPYSDAHRTRAGWTDPESAAVVYRRRVFEQAGLFDERLSTHEDVEFNTRVKLAGFRCWFAPQLRYSFHARRTLWGLFVQMFRYGRDRMRFLACHPQSFRPAFALPVTALTVAASLAILGAIWPSAWTVLGICAGAYVTVVVAVSARLAGEYGWRYFLLLPIAFATIHMGIALGNATGIALWRHRKLAGEREPAALPRRPG